MSASARGCFNCGIFGHQASDCKKDQICYNSLTGGNEGHISRECTGETKAKTCYKCRQEGHIVCSYRLLARIRYLTMDNHPSLAIARNKLRSVDLARSTVEEEEARTRASRSATAVEK
ncbi:hypothetical protein DFH11DRAFT_1008382 [Phellopilus nigrolimitatus]|nr:hypothetical protein DFH11DRAFT_1008382 [Phellopilus nigrolimitatus]